MVGLSQADRAKRAEYLEILDETIRTNPYRKAQSAMVSVMSKHGINSNNNALGRSKARSAPERRCALSKSLRLAQSCDEKLNQIKEDLQCLCNQLQQGTSTISNTPEEKDDKATMAGHLLTLIGEAETIAKRIYETAVGLHVAEDFLRSPEDLKLLDFSTSGRIQIPNYNFNHASQLCLEWLHSTACKWLRGFKEKSNEENTQFINIFENFTKAVKDYTEAVCLANQVFRILLYANNVGKISLQEYVLALGHVYKNDLIMELQSLRRTFDNIQYTFERIGWAASIAWMKYSGKNITIETLNENGIQVDHSIFQHKFYEGPPKAGKRVSSATTKKSKSKNLGGAAGATSRHSSKANLHKNASEKSMSMSAQQDDVNVKSNEFLTIPNFPKLLPEELPPRIVPSQRARATTAETAANAQQQQRQSQSASEVSITKSKKTLKKKTTKSKKSLLTVKPAKSTVIAGGGGNEDLNETSSVDTEFIHLPKNSAGKSLTNGPMLTSNVDSSELIPKIPAGLRQQFNAVFGTGPGSTSKKSIVSTGTGTTGAKAKSKSSRRDISSRGSGSKQTLKG